MFNYYDWGGYLEFELANVRTFIDTRVDMFEMQGVLRDYLQITSINNSEELYVPIYDAVLVVPGIILSAPNLIARWRRSFTAVTLLIFGCSWIPELVARATGLQILSRRPARPPSTTSLGIDRPDRSVACLSPVEVPSADFSTHSPAR